MVNEAEYAQPELHNGLESIARGQMTTIGKFGFLLYPVTFPIIPTLVFLKLNRTVFGVRYGVTLRTCKKSPPSLMGILAVCGMASSYWLLLVAEYISIT